MEANRILNPNKKEVEREYFHLLMGFPLSVSSAESHCLVNAGTGHNQEEQSNNHQYYVDERHRICHSYRCIKASCRQYEQQKCYKMIKHVLHIPEAL